jgi:hypothetical protein
MEVIHGIYQCTYVNPIGQHYGNGSYECIFLDIPSHSAISAAGLFDRVCLNSLSSGDIGPIIGFHLPMILKSQKGAVIITAVSPSLSPSWTDSNIV